MFHIWCSSFVRFRRWYPYRNLQIDPYLSPALINCSSESLRFDSPTLERLDRVFASEDWMIAHPNHILSALSSECSDHAPLKLNFLAFALFQAFSLWKRLAQIWGIPADYRRGVVLSLAGWWCISHSGFQIAQYCESTTEMEFQTCWLCEAAVGDCQINCSQVRLCTRL